MCETQIRVMSFNVLCIFCGGDEYDGWDERVVYFRDLFKRHQPDLIGLQELTFSADANDLLVRNPEYAAIYFTVEGSSGQGGSVWSVSPTRTSIRSSSLEPSPKRAMRVISSTSP